MRSQSLFNSLVVWILHSPAHRLMSATVVALTVSGRRSGRQYTVPVNYVLDGSTVLVVSRRTRTWWRNLLHEAPVTMRLRGHDIACVGRACTDPDCVAEGLRVFLRRSRRYQNAWAVPLDAEGNPQDSQDLARATQELVLIQLVPVVETNPSGGHEEVLHAPFHDAFAHS